MFALLGPLSALAGTELTTLKARLRRQLLLWSAVGILALVAFSFLLVAAHAALVVAVGPIIAPLIIAGAAILVALIVFLVFHGIETAESRRVEEKKRSAEVTALVTTAAITALPLLLPILRKAGLPVAGVVAAAIALTQAKSFRRPEAEDE